MYADLSTLYQLFLKSIELGAGICTDTRKIVPGCLYLALKGERFNGNSFAHQALELGALAAIVDEDLPEGLDNRINTVADGLRTLQELAHLHRTELAIPVICIGGSNGKTTTKELTAAVLGTQFNTFATQGNLNNHIGVPLSLLALRDHHQIAVIEVGANHLDETKLLAQIAAPDYGLVTNCGKDHLEGFGSIENVARANGELYDYLIETGGALIINRDEPLLKDYFKAKNTYSFPIDSDFQVEVAANSLETLQIQTHSGAEASTHLAGNFNVYNVAAALRVGKLFGIAEEKALAAIADYKPANMRSQWIESANNRVLLDAYNANPSSMTAALDSFLKLPIEGKSVILADMLELGDHSAGEHSLLGKYLADKALDTIVLIGKEMKYAAEYLPQSFYFESRDEAMHFLKDKAFRGKTWLLKGSRGYAVEKLIEAI